MTNNTPAVSQSRPPPDTGGIVWQIARAISWIGHPLVFVSVSLGVIVFFRLANRVGVSVLLALIFAVVLPTAWMLFRGVRSGRWSDADVSVRHERKRFYPPAILLSMGGIAALLVMRAPGFVLQGAITTLILLLISALINRVLKISLHSMFAFYCAVILLRINHPIGLIALVLAVLVAWSRLHLRRHALPDVVAGIALGVAGAVATAWWP
jgi:membrane-associated phospholipid phosphatase